MTGSAVQKDLDAVNASATGATLSVARGDVTLRGVNRLVVGDGLTLTAVSPGTVLLTRTAYIKEAYVVLTEDEGGAEFFPLVWLYLADFSEFQLQVYETSGANPTNFVVQWYNTGTATWENLSGVAGNDITTTGNTGTTSPALSSLTGIVAGAVVGTGVAVKLVRSTAGPEQLQATLYLRGTV